MKRGSAAFTLIELLTVIAIIGILASILVPVVASVRESGRRSMCLSNLRQIAVATQSYAADHDGQLPTPNWFESSFGWLYNAPIDRAPPRGSPFDPNFNRQVPALREGLLWPYLEHEEIYQCPTDWMNRDRLFEMRRQKLSSYVMNGSASAYSDGPALNIETFQQDSIMFWEADESIPFFYNDGANFPHEGISMRHGRGAHVAGLYGNVEIISQQDYALQLSLRPGRLWNNPKSPDGR